MRPPPGIKDDNDSGSDSEDSGPPIVFAARGKMLKRQDTFYDVNYDAVKVSTVPKSQEAWSFFMDMLKTEHRKFQMMVTTLRIERGKIMKEFQSFSDMFNEAKEHIKAQFETSVTDLKSVNCARLLKGEVNKRSTSFIKTTPVFRVGGSSPKAKHGSGKHSSASNSNINSALFSVREKFGDNEDDFDDEDDNDSESSKSSFSSRQPRPSIPMEFNISEKTEVYNIYCVLIFSFSHHLSFAYNKNTLVASKQAAQEIARPKISREYPNRTSTSGFGSICQYPPR